MWQEKRLKRWRENTFDNDYDTITDIYNEVMDYWTEERLCYSFDIDCNIPRALILEDIDELLKSNEAASQSKKEQ